MEYISVSVNASDYSINWGFADANHGRSSPNPTLKDSRHIKKLHYLAERQDIDLWFEDECHFQRHGSRCVMWMPPEDTDRVVLHAPAREHSPPGPIFPAKRRGKEGENRPEAGRRMSESRIAWMEG